MTLALISVLFLLHIQRKVGNQAEPQKVHAEKTFQEEFSKTHVKCETGRI